jgi:hypothetical protein
MGYLFLAIVVYYCWPNIDRSIFVLSLVDNNIMIGYIIIN